MSTLKIGTFPRRKEFLAIALREAQDAGGSTLEPNGKKGRLWEVVVIQEGKSLNGILYPRRVIEEAIPLFEGAPVMLYEFKEDTTGFDHLRGKLGELYPDGLAGNLVGWLRNVEARMLDGKYSVVAKLSVRDGAEKAKQLFLDAIPEGGIGLSINAEGPVSHRMLESGEIETTAEGIAKVHTVEVVTKPAAGGRVYKLVASRSWDALAGFRFVESEGLSTIPFSHSKASQGETQMPSSNAVALKPGQLGTKLFEAIKKLGLPKLLEGVSAETLAKDDNKQAVETLLASTIKALREMEGNGGDHMNQTVAFLRVVRDMIREGQSDEAALAIDEYVKKIAEAASQAAAAASSSGHSQGGNNVVNESATQAKLLEESLKTQRDELSKLQESYKKGSDDLNKLRESLQAEQKRAVLNRLLQESGLPQIAQDRVRKSCEEKIAAIDEAAMRGTIEEEVKYLASFAGDTGAIRGLGAAAAGSKGGGTSVGAEARDKVQAALDKGMGIHDAKFSEAVKKCPDVKRFNFIHEAYRAVTGRHDADAREIFRESIMFIPERDRKTPMAKFMESVKVSTWAEVLGDSVTRKLRQDYTLSDLNADWRKVVSEIGAAKDFRTIRRPHLGYYSTLSTVSEQGTYPTLTSPTDEEATLALAKRGGVDDLTMEAIANDDLGAIRRIPTRLARAAIQTMYRSVFDLLTSTSNIYDGSTLFAAGHTNSDNNTLTQANLGTGRQRMVEQSAYGATAELLGGANAPKFLIVPAELEETAFKLTHSAVAIVGTGESATTPNIHRAMGLAYVLVPHFSSATNWYLIGDPSKQPTIEVDFFNGEEEPELFIQNDPLQGSWFDADKAQYKIRFIWDAKVLEYRSFYLGGA